MRKRFDMYKPKYAIVSAISGEIIREYDRKMNFFLNTSEKMCRPEPRLINLKKN